MPHLTLKAQRDFLDKHDQGSELWLNIFHPRGLKAQAYKPVPALLWAIKLPSVLRLTTDTAIESFLD